MGGPARLAVVALLALVAGRAGAAGPCTTRIDVFATAKAASPGAKCIATGQYAHMHGVRLNGGEYPGSPAIPEL